MFTHIFNIGRRSLCFGLSSLILSLSSCQQPAPPEKIEQKIEDVSLFADGVYHPDLYNSSTVSHSADIISSVDTISPADNSSSPTSSPDVISLVAEEATLENIVSCINGETQEQPCDNSSPCIGYQRRVCIKDQWGDWSNCKTIRQLHAPLSLYNPVVSDYTLAALGLSKETGLNNSVYLVDLPSEEIVLLEGLHADSLQLDGHFLSGVYSQFPQDNYCQMIDLSSGEILHDGICPADIDKTEFVAQMDSSNLVVNNALFNEQLAALTSDQCVSTPVFDYETVAFVGRPLINGVCSTNSSIYLWRFIDEVLFSLPTPDKNQDKDPLLENDILLFSRYDSNNNVHVMIYDFALDDVQELFSAKTTYYQGITQSGSFNGTTLAFRTLEEEVRLYNIDTKKEVVIDSFSGTNSSSKPLSLSLDGSYLVWGKDGAVYYCPLEEEWKNK